LWGNIRGAAQVLAFFATVWALAVVFGFRYRVADEHHSAVTHRGD
jgi:hypothetical protein